MVWLAVSSCSDSRQTESLSSFSIAEGFKIELVAMEPLISDPVAMEIRRTWRGLCGGNARISLGQRKNRSNKKSL